MVLFIQSVASAAIQTSPSAVSRRSDKILAAWPSAVSPPLQVRRKELDSLQMKVRGIG